MIVWSLFRASRLVVGGRGVPKGSVCLTTRLTECPSGSPATVSPSHVELYGVSWSYILHQVPLTSSRMLVFVLLSCVLSPTNLYCIPMACLSTGQNLSLVTLVRSAVNCICKAAARCAVTLLFRLITHSCLIPTSYAPFARGADPTQLDG